LLLKTTFIDHEENDFIVYEPPNLLMLIRKLIVFNVTRWHKGVQSSNGPDSSCFNCFSGTWKEVSFYLCLFT